ncbi:hypothetical protein FNV43_RR00582 [Rhamnella rubrinervis]|uniref:Putative plant transposon protein domain-containing protein n=1 Tax=Rhamnella rubrinervis TaxID=2594499 RepID=A0A8K0HQX7_9ROSA|nr:hypothetical protein FNV43_RR00582 [Rhamnella rubrinervis]
MGRSRRTAQVGDQGPSSSRARTRVSGPVRSVWDRDRFTSRENARWYEEKKSNVIVVEKTVSEEVDSIFGIRRAFDLLGWAPVLCLEGKFYPRLVREFYANIEDKEDTAVHRVVTYVKGCRIDLDRATITCILGVSDDGLYVEFYKDAVLSDRQYKLVQALGRLNYSPTRNNRTADMVFRTPNLLVPQRLLVYMYSSNVLPRASSLNEVHCLDIYLLDKMLNGLQGIDGVPFASVVISHIHSDSIQITCYPLLLSKVFEFFGVDVTGEDIAVVGATDVLTEANLYRMGYVHVHGVWRNLVRHPLRAGEVVDGRNYPAVAVDDEGEHSEAPTSYAMPSTSTGATVHSSSVASALQRSEAICWFGD